MQIDIHRSKTAKLYKTVYNLKNIQLLFTNDADYMPYTYMCAAVQGNPHEVWIKLDTSSETFEFHLMMNRSYVTTYV